SVASLFLSRIDVLLDPRLEQVAPDLRGRVAIASARAAYAIYQHMFGGERFAALASRGARPQRLLWASTGTKDPSESDVKYLEALIGPETINTVPTSTLDAYRDHGQPQARLTDEQAESQAVLRRLAEVGVDLNAATQQLEDEGVAKFVEAFD